jgi:alpha-mannosidase
MYHKIRFAPQKFAQRLELIEPLVYRRSQNLPGFRFLRLDGPMAAPPVGPDVDDSAWEIIRPGDYWAGFWVDFTLRASFTIPSDWPAEPVVALYLPLGEAGDFSHPEALAYVDGVPYSSADRHHQEVRLSGSLRDGRQHQLALHGWAGGMEGNFQKKLLMKQCQVVQIDQPTRDFIVLGRTALGIANALDDNDPAKGSLYTTLDDAFKVLDTREPFGDRFYDSLPEATRLLQDGIARSGPALDVDISAVGHAHIAVAWLWTLGQTRRKAGRTFYNVIRQMEQFPEFIFAQSQPQLYDYVRQDYPDLFKAIQARAAEGRWETMGGMWVEADCNLSGSESLARQFLLGRSFFRQYFGGKDAPVLWLPDVFGYAWNLPQLIKEAGLEYFFTIKIGWNLYNRLPYDSFWWQGLDGTRVLTHFSTTPELGSIFASTYNANATPSQVVGTWNNFQQKDAGKPGVNAPLLMAYGYGDGGGGPTRQMIENIRSMGDFPATPHIHPGRVGDFFHKLESEMGERLPVWNAELYLEIHRGTYTTQARNKRANRKSEFRLHDAEFLASLASLLAPDYTYPQAELTQAWQLVCLNQFHDILPGSSVGPVYVESQEQYAQIQQSAQAVNDAALKAIAATVGGDMLLVNPTSFARRDLAFWKREKAGGANQVVQRSDGTPVSTQAVEGGLLLEAGELPPYSVTPLSVVKVAFKPVPTTAPLEESHLAASSNRLENDFLRVELNPAGDITRIYDKQNGCDVLPEGGVANQFQAFEDRPHDWDAWDIDIFYDDKLFLAEPASQVRVVEAGPLRAVLEIHRKILNSVYVQRISLCHNSPRLDFDTTIQWHEKHVLLKVAFPVDVLAPTATYEIQWGNVQRPTHRNTSWDWARFETCAHKWVDLSEGGYGASLLNDCKYGHDIHGNVMRISLLRATTMPDFDADQGEHHFAYSLLPHAGGWDASTIAEAYALNDPLIAWSNPAPRRAAAGKASFVSVDLPNVVIETVKKAEDGNGLIVRMYETQRKRSQVTLTTVFSLEGAWRTNLLEEDQYPLPVNDFQVKVPVKPYQIVTVRLTGL